MIYDEKEAVFYNKVQVLNRDLSIQTIKLFSEVITEERRQKYETKRAKYDTNPVCRIPFRKCEHKKSTRLDAQVSKSVKNYAGSLC